MERLVAPESRSAETPSICPVSVVCSLIARFKECAEGVDATIYLRGSLHSHDLILGCEVEVERGGAGTSSPDFEGSERGIVMKSDSFSRDSTDKTSKWLWTGSEGIQFTCCK